MIQTAATATAIAVPSAADRFTGVNFNHSSSSQATRAGVTVSVPDVGAQLPVQLAGIDDTDSVSELPLTPLQLTTEPFCICGKALPQ
jgi:hypothetical protein